jgi:putative ABC transport system permease protein
MNSLDLILMSLSNLWRRKVRTILTVLGVLIGTMSITLMLSLGFGINISFQKSLERMGSLNVIQVYNYYGGGYYAMDVVKVGGSDSEQPKLDDATCEKIANIDGVQSVLKMLTTSVKMGSGRYIAWVQLMGVNPEAMEYFDFEVDQGRLLTVNDTNAIVFGSDVPMNFYNPRDRRGGYWGWSANQEPNVNVLEDRLILTFDMNYGEPHQTPIEGGRRPKRYNVEGVGLLSWEGSQNYSWYAIANLDYVKKLIKENERLQGGGRRRPTSADTTYSQIKVRVKDMNKVVDVQNAIKEMGFQTYSLMDQMQEIQKTSRIIQAVLGGIGAISLLVAALGITNTMIMAIYERTREIGIMKVLGCLLKNIRQMFLIESGLIGFIGGVVGGGLSIGASYLLNKFLAPALMGRMGYGVQVEKISIIPPWLLLATVVFSTFVGLISGYSPARRAMKLSALSAIRTE